MPSPISAAIPGPEEQHRRRDRSGFRVDRFARGVGAGSCLYLPHLRQGEPLDRPLPSRTTESQTGRKFKKLRFQVIANRRLSRNAENRLSAIAYN